MKTIQLYSSHFLALLVLGLGVAPHSQAGKIPVVNKGDKGTILKIKDAEFHEGESHNCEALAHSTIELVRGEKIRIRFNRRAKPYDLLQGYLPSRGEFGPTSRCVFDLYFKAKKDIKVKLNTLFVTGSTLLRKGHALKMAATTRYNEGEAVSAKFDSGVQLEDESLHLDDTPLGFLNKINNAPCESNYRISIDFELKLVGPENEGSESSYAIGNIRGNKKAIGIGSDLVSRSC